MYQNFASDNISVTLLQPTLWMQVHTHTYTHTSLCAPAIEAWNLLGSFVCWQPSSRPDNNILPGISLCLGFRKAAEPLMNEWCWWWWWQWPSLLIAVDTPSATLASHRPSPIAHRPSSVVHRLPADIYPPQSIFRGDSLTPPPRPRPKCW